MRSASVRVVVRSEKMERDEPVRMGGGEVEESPGSWKETAELRGRLSKLLKRVALEG